MKLAGGKERRIMKRMFSFKESVLWDKIKYEKKAKINSLNSKHQKVTNYKNARIKEM